MDGAWLNSETSQLIREKVVLAYTYVDPDAFEATLPELRTFLHQLGRETDQGEVAFEFDDRLFKIRTYDPASASKELTMAKRIALTGTTNRQIVLKDTAARRISPSDVGDRLGAESVGAAPAMRSRLTFAAVRQEAFQRLKSTGGRRGLEGAERKKIPLTHRDWQIVERVADHIAEPGFRPSPGQVASILLSMTLDRMDKSVEAAVKRTLKSSI